MQQRPAHSLPGNSTKATKGDRFGLVAVSMLGLVLFFLVLLVLPQAGLLFRFYSTPSTSMEPNYHIGGYTLINRASYGFSSKSFDWFSLPIAGRWPDLAPQRGDVIVFKQPKDGRTDFVKRVIGIGGDKVQMIKDEIWLNGELVQRNAEGTFEFKDASNKTLAAPVYRETLPGGVSFAHVELEGAGAVLANTEIFEVPARQLFVLGDNRDNSTDSRVPPTLNGIGFVPVEFVVGRVIATFGGTP